MFQIAIRYVKGRIANTAWLPKQLVRMSEDRILPWPMTPFSALIREYYECEEGYWKTNLVDDAIRLLAEANCNSGKNYTKYRNCIIEACMCLIASEYDMLDTIIKYMKNEGYETGTFDDD